MKKYIIYDMQTEEKLGEVMAYDVVNAELKFLKNNYNFGSNDIYALSAEE